MALIVMTLVWLALQAHAHDITNPTVSSNATGCSVNSGQTVKCAQAGHAGGNCAIIQNIPGGNPSSCCQACSSNPGCNFWVFNTQYNYCYLKQGDSSYRQADPSCSWGVSAAPAPSPPAPAPTPSGCGISGGHAVKCAHDGQPGGNCKILQIIDGGTSAQCCQACGYYTGCNFWVFNQQYNQCYLKSGDSSYVIADSNCDWGRPGQNPPPSPPPPAACQGSRLNQQAVKCKGPDHAGGQCVIVQNLTTSSADQCCQWCAGLQACDFWVLDGKSCYLKRGDSSYIIQDAAKTAGVKNNRPPNTWPQFGTQSDMQGSHWQSYFNNLYGAIPPAGAFPLDLRNFWCFYKDKMAAAQIQAPPSVGQCPTSKVAPEGQRYDENNAYSSKDLTWAWHPLSDAPFQGLSANSIVEVSHTKDPFGDETHGMWFLYAKGSGVYFNVGNTKVFNEHSDAETFFGVKGNAQMCLAAAGQGYDSVQFIRHVDGTNYPCASKIGVSWMNMEIVAVKLVGTYSCGQAQGTPSSLRAGWDGDKACNCDPSNPNTNCVFSRLQGKRGDSDNIEMVV